MRERVKGKKKATEKKRQKCPHKLRTKRQGEDRREQKGRGSAS